MTVTPKATFSLGVDTKVLKKCGDLKTSIQNVPVEAFRFIQRTLKSQPNC